MKILKKIFYTICGLLLAASLSLIGVILYAEYSGRRFSPSKADAAENALSDGESRLAYDENGNLAELPGTADTPSQPGQAAAPAQGNEDTSAEVIDTSASSPENPAPASGTDVSNINPEGSDPSMDTAKEDNGGTDATPSEAGGDIERPYIMDTGSGLFHTADCPDAAAIASEQRSERTTARSKILDAGYKSCPNCNP